MHFSKENIPSHETSRASVLRSIMTFPGNAPIPISSRDLIFVRREENESDGGMWLVYSVAADPGQAQIRQCGLESHSCRGEEETFILLSARRYRNKLRYGWTMRKKVLIRDTRAQLLVRVSLAQLRPIDAESVPRG